MSTMMDSVAGKGQNLSTRAWAAILILSLVVFGANTLYATTKAARVGGASTAASNRIARRPTCPSRHSCCT